MLQQAKIAQFGLPPFFLVALACFACASCEVVASDPQLAHLVAPSYPLRARTARIAGEVTVAISVAPSGIVSRATVLASASPILADEAERTLRRWVFTSGDTTWRSRVKFRFGFSGREEECEPRTVVYVDLFALEVTITTDPPPGRAGAGGSAQALSATQHLDWAAVRPAPAVTGSSEQPHSPHPPLRVQRFVSPGYVRLARNARLSGKVALEFNIDDDGRPVNLSIRGADPVLRQCAWDAFKNWLFLPSPPEIRYTLIFEFGFPRKRRQCLPAEIVTAHLPHSVSVTVDGAPTHQGDVIFRD